MKHKISYSHTLFLSSPRAFAGFEPRTCGLHTSSVLQLQSFGTHTIETDQSSLSDDNAIRVSHNKCQHHVVVKYKSGNSTRIMKSQSRPAQKKLSTLKSNKRADVTKRRIQRTTSMLFGLCLWELSYSVINAAFLLCGVDNRVPQLP